MKIFLGEMTEGLIAPDRDRRGQRLIIEIRLLRAEEKLLFKIKVDFL